MTPPTSRQEVFDAARRWLDDATAGRASVGSGANEKVTVRFPSGEKTLLAQFVSPVGD